MTAASTDIQVIRGFVRNAQCASCVRPVAGTIHCTSTRRRVYTCAQQRCISANIRKAYTPYPLKTWRFTITGATESRVVDVQAKDIDDAYRAAEKHLLASDRQLSRPDLVA